MNDKLSSNLRKCRTEKNVSQKELSQMTGISVRCLEYYECLTNIPSLLNAYRLAKTLDTPISELFPYDNESS